MQHERRCATRSHLVGGLVAPRARPGPGREATQGPAWSRSSRSLAGPACDQDPTRQPPPQSRTRTAALSVSQSKSTYLAAWYRRRAITTSPVKTIVAIEQHADHDLADCHDRRPRQRPGRDFYTRRHLEKAKIVAPSNNYPRWGTRHPAATPGTRDEGIVESVFWVASGRQG